jgi:hypothetical protein
MARKRGIRALSVVVAWIERLWHFPRRFPECRRSSVVEHVLGKDGVECSIHFGGTTGKRFPLRL